MLNRLQAESCIIILRYAGLLYTLPHNILRSVNDLKELKALVILGATYNLSDIYKYVFSCIVKILFSVVSFC